MNWSWAGHGKVLLSYVVLAESTCQLSRDCLAFAGYEYVVPSDCSSDCSMAHVLKIVIMELHRELTRQPQHAHEGAVC